MTIEKPTEAPKEGYEWVLRKNAKMAGYIEAMIDAGKSPDEASILGETKYPPEYVQKKIGTSDHDANINEALNGLVGFLNGFSKENPEVERDVLVRLVSPAIKRMGLKTGYRYGPNIYKTGERAGQYQMTPVYSKKDAIPDGKKIGDPKPEAKKVYRWLATDEPLSLEAQTGEVVSRITPVED